MISKATTIRKYQASDRDECLQAFISNVPTYFTNEEILDFENFLIRMEAVETETHFYVVCYESQLIGCGGFGDKDGTGEISLAWGLIDSKFHKKGFGLELLKFRLHKIKDLMPEKTLVLDTTQYSYGFFEKYGFQVQKITLDFYADGLHRYDMVFAPQSS